MPARPYEISGQPLSIRPYQSIHGVHFSAGDIGTQFFQEERQTELCKQWGSGKTALKVSNQLFPRDGKCIIWRLKVIIKQRCYNKVNKVNINRTFMYFDC